MAFSTTSTRHRDKEQMPKPMPQGIYSDENIQVLEVLEVVRRRTAMYIGEIGLTGIRPKEGRLRCRC